LVSDLLLWVDCLIWDVQLEPARKPNPPALGC